MGHWPVGSYAIMLIPLFIVPRIAAEMCWLRFCSSEWQVVASGVPTLWVYQASQEIKNLHKLAAPFSSGVSS